VSNSVLHNAPSYLLTYLALQPRFGQGLSEKIPPLCSILSEVRSVTGHKDPAIAVYAIRPPGFWSFLVHLSPAPLFMCQA
jgi:hypothetical protein